MKCARQPRWECSPRMRGRGRADAYAIFVRSTLPAAPCARLATSSAAHVAGVQRRLWPTPDGTGRQISRGLSAYVVVVERLMIGPKARRCGGPEIEIDVCQIRVPRGAPGRDFIPNALAGRIPDEPRPDRNGKPACDAMIVRWRQGSVSGPPPVGTHRLRLPPAWEGSACCTASAAACRSLRPTSRKPFWPNCRSSHGSGCRPATSRCSRITRRRVKHGCPPRGTESRHSSCPWRVLTCGPAG